MLVQFWESLPNVVIEVAFSMSSAVPPWAIGDLLLDGGLPTSNLDILAGHGAPRQELLLSLASALYASTIALDSLARCSQREFHRCANCLFKFITIRTMY